MSKAAEGGMLRSILGHQLINMSEADLVIFVRSKEFLWSMEQLNSEGWDTLEGIEFSRMDQGSMHFMLTYRLRSKFRLHQLLGVQVQIDVNLVWPSITAIFPEAAKLEALGDEEGIIFGTPSHNS